MTTVRLLLLASALFLVSCSTTGIRVPVLVPAPVNLVQFDRIAVDSFRGDGCEAFSEELTAALRNAENPLTGQTAFEVLHRRDIDAALDRAREQRGQDWDQRTMEILDQWRTAQVALSGEVQVHQVRDEVTEQHVQDDKGNQWVEFVRSCAAEVCVQLQVHDLDGNVVFDRADLASTAAAQTRAVGGQPDQIDYDALLAHARRQVVEQYLKRVLPHHVFVHVSLYTDGDVPDLQVGNGYAEAGNWEQAVQSYLRALEAMSGDLAEVRYKGLFNLGVAYEFTDRFAEARQALQEAYALAQDSMILQELRRVDRREQQVEALRAQGAQAAQPQR